MPHPTQHGRTRSMSDIIHGHKETEQSVIKHLLIGLRVAPAITAAQIAMSHIAKEVMRDLSIGIGIEQMPNNGDYIVYNLNTVGACDSLVTFNTARTDGVLYVKYFTFFEPQHEASVFALANSSDTYLKSQVKLDEKSFVTNDIESMAKSVVQFLSS